MDASYEKALEVFSALTAMKRLPSLHPYYVVTDALRQADLRPVFFIYEEGADIYYHGFHLAPVPETALNDIQSPYGYGGPVATTTESGFLGRAWSSYLSWCAENRVLAEFVRFHPLLENWHYYQGDVVDDRETVWVDLTSSGILMTYSTRARTAVRKAIKSGLHVEWEQGCHLAPLFSCHYQKAMDEIGADKSYYFNDDYFGKLIQWDKSRLALCKLGDDLLAVAIFLFEGTFMEYHLSASTSLGKTLAATNLILHEAALLGQRLGCSSLHLGGGTDSRPDNPLLFFKGGHSSNRGLFQIGKQVHQVEAYAALKREWLKKHCDKSNRILFYRA